MNILRKASLVRAAAVLLLFVVLIALLGVQTSQMAAAPELQEIKILPIGDSITSGYNANKGNLWQASYRLPLYGLLTRYAKDYTFTFIGTDQKEYKREEDGGPYPASYEVSPGQIKYVAKPKRTTKEIYYYEYDGSGWGVRNLKEADLAGNVWALIHVGTNDVRKSRDWVETEEYLNKILFHLQDPQDPDPDNDNKMTVFIAKIIPVNHPDGDDYAEENTKCKKGENFAVEEQEECENLTNKHIRDFNAKLVEWCGPDNATNYYGLCHDLPEEMSDIEVYLVDQYMFNVIGSEPEPLEDVLSGDKDNVHPNKTGEAYIALRWYWAVANTFGFAKNEIAGDFCTAWELVDESCLNPGFPGENGGSIKITKEIVGPPPGDDWEFSGAWTFTLPAGGDSKLFQDLDPYTYHIIEAPRDGWDQEVTCSNGVQGTNSVEIVLQKDENVECTFKNTNSNPVDSAVAVNDRYDVNKDQTLYVGPPGILANDILANGEARAYYLADGQQVYEMGWYEGAWHNRHISVDPNWPLPAGRTMASTSVYGAPLLYYASNDGHVHQIAWHWDDNAWHHEWDITQVAGGPPPVEGTLNATTVNGNPRVYYLAADAHVHELAWVVDKWYQRDVTADAGGPAAVAGSALGVTTITNDDPRIYYLAEGDGGLHVHELAWRSLTHVWTHTDVTAAVGDASHPLDLRALNEGTSPLSVTTENLFPLVYYLASVDGETHVCELFWDNDYHRWYHDDKTSEADGHRRIPRPASVTPLGATITAAGSMDDKIVYYQARAEDEDYSNIYELGWYDGNWRNVTLEGDGASPDPSSPLAVTAAGLYTQVYYLADHNVHQLARGFRDTWQDTNLMIEPGWPKAISDSPLTATTGSKVALTAKLANETSHGELALSEDGSFVYEPEAGYSGRDSFTYVASNDFTHSAVVTVELDVTDECAPVGGNVLTNFCFVADRKPWRFYHNDHQGYYTVSKSEPFAGEYSAKVVIHNRGRNVQLYQRGLVLQPNTTYELSFAAYSNNGRDMRLYVHKHWRPYTNYGLTKRVNLEPYWKYFTMTFTTPNLPDMNDARLRFWFAPDARMGTVYHIDRVILRPVSSP